jgi:ribosome biogenesis GTPase A
MNEKVENLILEHLRAMRGDMAKMSERVDVISAEILIIRQHMAGLLGSQTLHDTEIAG